MQRTKLTKVALIALVMVFAGSAAHAAAMNAKLTKIKGDVQYRKNASGTWQKAAEGMLLAGGAQVKCGPASEVYVGWGAGNVVKVSALSQVTIDSLTKEASGASKSKVNLDSGKVFAKAGKMNKGSTFEVKTPSAIAGVRGTGFECSETSVSVVEGSVEVTAGGQTIEVAEGLVTETVEGEAPGTPEAIPPETAAELQTDLQSSNEVSTDIQADYESGALEGGEEGETKTEGEGETKDETLAAEETAATDSIDTALDNQTQLDIVDQAEGGLFEPGTGGIMGTIEY